MERKKLIVRAVIQAVTKMRVDLQNCVFGISLLGRRFKDMDSDLCDILKGLGEEVG